MNVVFVAWNSNDLLKWYKILTMNHRRVTHLELFIFASYLIWGDFRILVCLGSSRQIQFTIQFILLLLYYCDFFFNEEASRSVGLSWNLFCFYFVTKIVYINWRSILSLFTLRRAYWNGINCVIPYPYVFYYFWFGTFINKTNPLTQITMACHWILTVALEK